MPQIRAVQVPRAGGDFELVEREAPEPGHGEVRVTVQACGICHSDALTKEGHWPGIAYPRVPGHEIAGVVDLAGEGVEGWVPGQRVGIGWFGGICRRCDPCRRGDFIDCVALRIPGISYDGGYAEAVVVPEEALARVPDDLAAEDAAPLMCAGITTFNALRHSGALPGDVVAVLGVGGLGHLGVQYAARLGFRTVAIARGKDKEALAHDLGAHHYIDSTSADVAGELQAIGGAKVVLATVTSAAAMAAAFDGLGARGRLVVVGAAPDPIEVSPAQLITNSRTITGHASGTSKDSEDTLAFSDLVGIRPRIETLPLERAAEAYDRMMAGDARFRMVLTTGR
jgi:D-arabinose 1-dehydrogenase-like Zn-dependent alcohol dehydrogenase